MNLNDRYLEKDLEDAVMRELEQFLLELGVGFCFVERQKRIIIDDEDFHLDLLITRLNACFTMDNKMPQNLLDVKDLHVYFPMFAGILRREVAVVKAVRGVDFTIGEGEVVGVVGESGCRKSTIGRAAIRLVEATSGTVKFLDRDLKSFDKNELMQFRREAQTVFQDTFSSLNPRKSIGNAIGGSLLYHGLVKTVEEQQDRVADGNCEGVV